MSQKRKTDTDLMLKLNLGPTTHLVDNHQQINRMLLKQMLIITVINLSSLFISFISKATRVGNS